MEEDGDSVEEGQKRQEKILMNRISFADDPNSTQIRKYNYNPESINPFIQFYKLLALKPCEKNHRNKLILNIPDTIVFNDRDCPLMWIYTNQRGQVCRLDNSAYYQITAKLTQGALQKQLVAVLKKVEYGYRGVSGNDIKVISSMEIKSVLTSVLNLRNEASVIQRFVKCQSAKPSIMRTAYRKNGHHEAWILTSNYAYTSTAKVNQISKFIVNTKMFKAFTAVKCSSEKHIKQTLAFTHNVLKFVEGHLPLRFTELVCDFIKDQGGNWWFIGTRAFILEDQQKIVDCRPITMHDDEIGEQDKLKRKKLESYTKCKKCKYCYKTVAEHLLNHKLTLMMILQCDQHLIKMGKQFAWLERSYSQHLDAVNLYVEHKVCDSCFKFYKEVQQLVAFQTKFAELSGIKLPPDNKNNISITSVPSFKGESPQFGSRLQKVKYQTTMPAGWELPQHQQIKMELANQKTNIQKYRLMVYVHGLRDIPSNYKSNANKYFLQYDFFGVKVKYLINFEESIQMDQAFLKVDMNKLKIMYFFASNRNEVKQFIKESPNFTITLLENEEIFGTVQLEMDDFKSDKVIKRDFFKMFSGKKVLPFLSWGLFVSVGLHESGEISSSCLRLRKEGDLLIPEIDYHNCDLFPEEWVSMFEEKPTKQKQSSQKEGTDQSENELAAESRNYLASEIEDYSKRKAVSQHQIRKKPYY